MRLANIIWMVVAVMGGSYCLAGGNLIPSFKDALTKGASARVRLCVQDERGVPITNANIRATLANREADYSMHGLTDTNGVKWFLEILPEITCNSLCQRQDTTILGRRCHT